MSAHTAWDRLLLKSSASAGSIAWDHLSSVLAGGDITQNQIGSINVITDAMSKVVKLEGSIMAAVSASSIIAAVSQQTVTAKITSGSIIVKVN